MNQVKNRNNRARIKVDKPMRMSSKQSNMRSSKRNSNTNASTVVLPQGLKLHTRNLMTAYVNHNKQTSLWLTTINTNQEGNRQSSKSKTSSLKAFSFRTEHEARESAYVNAPPKMIPFQSSPHCFNCDSKFNSVFRRPSHCRNCGVCICSTCTVPWSKLMIPETYNTKNTKNVKVCKTCDYLSAAFRHYLLKGDYDGALKIYMTGNINLRCPFLNVKKGHEIMLPIHCAVAGGNLKLLVWLVDVHHCPLKMTNTNNRHKQGTTQLIKTSNGRTVVDIAIEDKKVDILQYLVNQKRVSVSSEGSGNLQALSALEAVLKAMPDSPRCIDQKRRKFNSQNGVVLSRRKTEGIESRSNHMHNMSNPYLETNDDSYDEMDHSASFDTDEEEDVDNMEEEEVESVATTVKDPCIICYERSINCVLTPCGHQICCLHCSENMTKCPICSTNCQSIRIFRP